MKKIVFDIETQNEIFDTPEKLDIALVAIYDYETDKYDSFLQEDLGRLWPIIENADVLIGFNSDHFDIPLLNKYYSGDLTKIKSIDILKDVRVSLGHRIGLNKIAQGTLNAKKSGNGLEAIEWWKNGEIEKVRKYCIDDVRITKEIYEYALKNKSLKYKQDEKIFEIPIDTSDWEKASGEAISFTLPF